MTWRPAQGSLFGDTPDRMPSPAEPEYYWADPDEVREELTAVLDTVRAAAVMPWCEERARYWQTVFPQMTGWLHPAEAERMRAEFAAEMERLTAAAR